MSIVPYKGAKEPRKSVDPVLGMMFNIYMSWERTWPSDWREVDGEALAAEGRALMERIRTHERETRKTWGNAYHHFNRN